MSSFLTKKINRYSGLLKEVENWPSFLAFKMDRHPEKSFTFKLRNSFSITVPKKLLPPFKEIFFDQVYLQNLRQKLLLKENPTILDIGANVGYFSLFMLFNYPNARVYCFEPMPFNYKKILEYKDRYGFTNLHAVNKAVSDSNSGILMNYAIQDSFTTMASIHAHSGKANRMEVDSVKLETFLKNKEINTVDFLKMDCEGAEYSILYATPENVLRRIKAMTIETHQSKKENENLPALSLFLKKNGFKTMSRRDGSTGYIWAWQ